MRLTSSVRRQRPGSASRKGSRGQIPALLTSTSTRPCASTQASTRASTAAASATSPATAVATRPCSRRRAALASTRSASRSLRTTAAPASARRVADARPSPCPAPVTIATRPSNERSSASGRPTVSMPRAYSTECLFDNRRVALASSRHGDRPRGPARAAGGRACDHPHAPSLRPLDRLRRRGGLGRLLHRGRRLRRPEPARTPAQAAHHRPRGAARVHRAPHARARALAQAPADRAGDRRRRRHGHAASRTSPS